MRCLRAYLHTMLLFFFLLFSCNSMCNAQSCWATSNTDKCSDAYGEWPGEFNTTCVGNECEYWGVVLEWICANPSGQETPSEIEWTNNRYTAYAYTSGHTLVSFDNFLCWKLISCHAECVMDASGTFRCLYKGVINYTVKDDVAYGFPCEDE